MIWELRKNSKAETPKGVTVNRPTRSDDGRAEQKKANKPERKIDMIELAIAYAAAHGNTEEAKNDAANIYSSNYEEYMEIWTAIKDL